MARILIIDDCMTLRHWQKDTFEKAGHDVVEAGDGLAAMSILRQQTLDPGSAICTCPDREGLKPPSRFAARNLAFPSW